MERLLGSEWGPIFIFVARQGKELRKEGKFSQKYDTCFFHIDGQWYMHSVFNTKQARRGSGSIRRTDNAKICDEARITDFNMFIENYLLNCRFRSSDHQCLLYYFVIIDYCCSASPGFP